MANDPPTQSLVHQLAHWATHRPRDPVLHERDASGAWRSLTWADYWDAVRRVAKGLMAMGHAPGEAVAIVGVNRADWVICELGIMAAGGMPAPIYTTSTADQTAYIVQQSGARIAICDGAEQLDKYRYAIEQGWMAPEHLVTMDEVPTAAGDDRVRSLRALMEAGAGTSDAELDARIAALGPDDTGLLIYTSGTTGKPKGAELTHRGLTSIGQMVLTNTPEIRDIEAVLVSYLPLSHVAEQIFTNFVVLAVGGTVWFCPELAQLKDVLVVARPTVFLGVPRVWEKFEAALAARFAEATGVKAKLLRWARDVERTAFQRSVTEDRDVESWQRRLAHRLVLSKIKTGLGLDRLYMAISGAAPIATSTLDFFASIGIPIHEGYGMTETTGGCTTQPLNRPRFGTVGQPLPGVEVRVADDGELLLRGPNMTKGYFRKPEETAELYTDGWLHTGDLASIDRDGFLRITGRKKDILITAGGKNVAPAEIEQHLAGIPGVGQVMIVGDRKPYLTALFALDADARGNLARAAGLSDRLTVKELAAAPAARAVIQKHVDDANAKVARYQTIKRFAILPEPFSVDGGEITPTMKVKRKTVMDKYALLIDGLYADGRPEASGEPASPPA